MLFDSKMPICPPGQTLLEHCQKVAFEKRIRLEKLGTGHTDPSCSREG
jgi:hypothetical protein